MSTVFVSQNIWPQLTEAERTAAAKLLAVETESVIA
jgi:hypothetical protein